MLRMDQVHVVRQEVLVEGRSQRAVARELGLARVTVRTDLEQAAPMRKMEAGPRARPVWETWSARGGGPCWPSRSSGPGASSG